MVKKTQNNKNHQDQDDDTDKQLNVLWKNWASRRRCERTHLPRFAKDDQNEEE